MSEKLFSDFRLNRAQIFIKKVEKYVECGEKLALKVDKSSWQAGKFPGEPKFE